MYSNYELNNYNQFDNNAVKRIVRKISDVSVSSIGSDVSDFSEDGKLDVQILDRPPDLANKLLPNIKEKLQRGRSSSLGTETENSINDENFEVFPSLPDAVLEKLDLLGDGPREQMNEENVEQKFISLSLAFSIDGATINDRCDRQRRHRDQSETNLLMEIKKMKDKLSLIQPLCTDFESAELLSILLAQLEVITRALSMVLNSAERYGAVQHEKRLTESVQLMVNHVKVLKQQRDTIKKQLEYTKRVLQSSSVDGVKNVPQKQVSAGKHLINKRRASIAIINQPFAVENNRTKPIVEKKLISRRTSEISLSAPNTLNRNRSNRLELVKIREGFTDDQTLEAHVNSHDSDGVLEEEIPTNLISDTFEVDTEDESFVSSLKTALNKFKEISRTKYGTWRQKTTGPDFVCFFAVLCFATSLVIIINIFTEYQRNSNNPNVSLNKKL